MCRATALARQVVEDALIEAILGDAMVAAALIDRLVHHAEIVALKGKSYRRERGGRASAAQAPSLRDSA